MSNSNDNQAVTIEVANIEAKEPYRISDAAYNALVMLLVDICRRNGIKQLLWEADKSLIGQTGRQNMTVHRWFAAKSCPDTWLYEHHGQIAAEVNTRLNAEEDDDMDLDRFKELMKEYRKELQDNDAGTWSEEDRQWAIKTGLFSGAGTDDNGQPNYMWCDTLTREQAAALLHRFAILLGKA